MSPFLFKIWTLKYTCQSCYVIGKLRALELRVVQTSFLCPVQSSICLERANAAEIKYFCKIYPGSAVRKKVDSDFGWWKLKTGDCPNARKTLQGHDGRFRRGRVWGSAPSCAGSSSKPVSPAGLPSLCFQRACQRCPSVLELFPRIDLCTCLFLAAQGFHVESNVKSVIWVRRKRFLLKKQPIQLFLSYMGKSTQAWYCSCFAFKKTLHLSLFGPATTGILA